MFRAVRATAQRISTLTVASVVALSSLTVLSPLFMSQSVAAAGATNVITNEASWSSRSRNGGTASIVTGGLKLTTSDNTSKAAIDLATNFNLGDVMTPSITWGNVVNQRAGINLSVDVDNNGSFDGYLVIEESASIAPNWWLAEGTPAAQATAPHDLSQPSYRQYFGTADQWKSAFPSAKVLSVGVSLGSGAGTSENTISQITTGVQNYTFQLAAPIETVSPKITIKGGSDSIGYNGVYRKISFKLQDNVGVKRWNINGGAWANVTVNKYGDVNNKTVGSGGVVNGSNVITLEDTSGNATSLTFFMNNVGPTITVKPSSVGSAAHQIFSEVDFALQDPNHVDRLTLNGVLKDLTNNQWSDLNNVRPGQFGAVAGTNTLVVFDGIGNSSTYTFTLDVSTPQIHIKSADNGYTPFSTGNDGVYSLVNFKLQDNTLVHSFSINGSEFTELTPDPWSDVNDVHVGHLGAVAGWNTITVRDIAGNESNLDFFLDGTTPTVSVKGVGNDYAPASLPVEDEENTFTEVSFKLFDANKIDKVTINGILKDLSNDKWSDVNNVRPGVFGAQLGLNVLVAYDLAGNTTTYEFTLVEPATDPDNGGGQGGGEEEEEESTPPAEEPLTPVVPAVLAVAQLITGANDGSRVLASSSANNQSQTNGQVQAAETTNGDNAVDGAVDEDDQKLVEDARSVFDYWWIIILALLGIFWFIAAKRRKNEE